MVASSAAASLAGNSFHLGVLCAAAVDVERGGVDEASQNAVGEVVHKDHAWESLKNER